jgi:uncharacterized integral membrane protein (TIGR00697 family)
MYNNKIWEDRLYLILTGIFIASLVSCNLIFQKFFQLEIWLPFIGSYTFEQSVGLLPYPVTFLVTDIISEIYGKKKADQVVMSGLIASIFMLSVITVSDYVQATSWSAVNDETFNQVFGLSGAAVFASMMAYLTAQLVDVRIFHFWKKLTKGSISGFGIMHQLYFHNLLILFLFYHCSVILVSSPGIDWGYYL